MENKVTRLQAERKEQIIFQAKKNASKFIHYLTNFFKCFNRYSQLSYMYVHFVAIGLG